MRLFGPAPSRGLIVVNPVGIVLQDPLTFLLQVLELTPMHGPSEDADDGQHEHGRQGDQEVQDFHGATPIYRAARMALPTTTSELTAMPRPAAQGGSQPTSASGMHDAL